ncbi:Exportin [Phytophthora megakarya]|uniref:Exportin n=1 Tax=Phytophthora megakarya TaxID=4795 RepID=A0A225WVT3_9STRA|nr:Exportin [Phytophthora megakarya]
MDPQLYQQVLLAVQVSHSPLASPSDRQAAYAFCEQFKSRSDCALYAAALYRNPGGGDAMELHTRQHFALHVLEHHVLTRWDSLPAEEQQKMRVELVELLLREAQSEDEPVFVREKKVALLAQIAKRQFPQRWPELLPELLQVWQTGESQVELVLLILRSLAEDCVSSSFNTSIPPARRKDILQGLNVCLPQLFPVVYHELEKQYAVYKAQTATPVQKNKSQRLIHAALDMLKEFLEWMPLERPVDPSTNFILVAVLLLEEKEFRVAGAECLEVYMTRGFGKENRAIMLQSISQTIEKLDTLDLTTLEPDLEANLLFHKKVNEMLVTWGTCQLDVLLLDGPGEQEMVLLRVILKNLCKLFAHPSLILTEAQIILWLTVLKNKTILKQGETFLSDILEQLRQAQELFATDRVTDTEGVMLYEMLVLVSNSMENKEERWQFVQQIVQDPLTQWTSPEMTTLISSPQNIVTAIEAAANDEKSKKLLGMIIKTLTTLYGIAKRAGVTFSPKNADNTGAFEDEVAQLLGGKNQLEEEEVAKLPVASKWSKWHKNVASMLQNSMLSDLDSMEHRHLKGALAYVYLPFLKSCPRELYPSLLDPVLATLFGHFAQRATSIFQRPNAGDKAVHTTWNTLVVGIEDAKQDIAREKMVMELTRQFIDFIEYAIDPKTVVGSDTDNPKHVTSPEDAFLRDYILTQSPSLPFAIGAILVQVICWKDTLSCRKAVLLGDKLVNILHTNTKYHTLLGRDLFSAALQGILREHVGHVKEDGLKWEIINLARNIYYRLTLGLIPVEECKGIDPCNQPLRPASSLCAAPREILLSLPDVTAGQVEALDTLLREKHSMKTQKNAFKELLEMPILAIRREKALASGSTSPLAGILGSNTNTSGKKILDLPEKLVIPSKEFDTQVTNLDTRSLFGAQ